MSKRPHQAFRSTTGDTLVADLENFATWVGTRMHETDDEGRAELATWLNRKLDELHRMDAFGTEGQCDPRGDHRE